jgi:hypothetical protein
VYPCRTGFRGQLAPAEGLQAVEYRTHTQAWNTCTTASPSTVRNFQSPKSRGSGSGKTAVIAEITQIYQAGQRAPSGMDDSELAPGGPGSSRAPFTCTSMMQLPFSPSSQDKSKNTTKASQLGPRSHPSSRLMAGSKQSWQALHDSTQCASTKPIVSAQAGNSAGAVEWYHGSRASKEACDLPLASLSLQLSRLGQEGETSLKEYAGLQGNLLKY